METSLTNSWGDLTPVCLLSAFEYLDYKSLLRCSRINKYWKTCSETPALWKTLLCRNYAFRMLQLQNEVNVLNIYKRNWILRNNIKEDRFESKKCPFNFDNVEFSGNYA